MKIKVWDIPTRVFHWLLVSSYVTLYFTSRSEWLLDYHTAAGYIALGLVVFRLFWGFAGNPYARFTQFIKGWRDVGSYLLQAARLKPPRFLGHNPAVGWVVIAMLSITAVLTITGIITYSGEENRGFWAGYFTFDTATYARDIHEFLADFMVAVIVVHVGAALFHDFILRENIILSMITGVKEDPESWIDRFSKEQGVHKARPVLRLVVWLLVTVLGGLGLIYLPPKGRTDFSKLRQPRVINEKGFAVELPPDPVWKAECATSCHGAFHPILLPAESWKRIVAGLDNHFGDNASVDEAARKEILDYLLSSSADRSTTEASMKLLNSIEKGRAVLRITEIPYWVAKHSDIAEEVYKRSSVVSKSNCKACHPGADTGSFEDRDIRIPD